MTASNVPARIEHASSQRNPSPSDARALVPGRAGEHSVSVLKHGTADVKLAVAPAVPPTLLTPHAQDEIYVVVRGRGVLFHDGRRDAFEAGDLMFVAAGVEHRFEGYSQDLAVWVIFYGPAGGEMPYCES